MSRRIVSGMMLTLLLISVVTLAINVQSASASTTVQFSPETTHVERPGLTFTVNITITNVTNLDAWVLDVAWDPKIIRVTTGDPNGLERSGTFYNIYEGPFMKDVLGDRIFLANEVNNGAGHISCLADAYLRLGIGVNGSGVLATINFTAINIGVTTLNISGPSPYYPDSLLVDRFGKEISHEDIDGTVAVLAICVDDDNVSGPWDGSVEHPYQSITNALQCASTNDAIFVRNGIYHELLIVDKTISLVGENKEATVIDGGGNGTVVYVNANNVKITGFTIQGGDSWLNSGVCLHLSNNSVVSDNVLKNNDRGIHLDYSTNNAVSANSIINNTYCGIYLSYSESNTIGDNHIENHDQSGIELWYSEDNIVVDNAVMNNHGIGVGLTHSKENIIRRNIVSNQPLGIDLYQSHSNEIYENQVTSNGDGIYLDDSNTNIVSNNTITNNDYYGIELDGYSNIVKNNSIIANGIDYGYANLRVNTSGNFVIGNTISDGWTGIILGLGGNVIYHNNFVNNTNQVFQISSGINTWDDGYPWGGNYWSDYTGSDLFCGPYQNETGSDGIGDMPRGIDEINVDRYPLIVPISLFSVAWNETDYIIGFISNSAISNLYFDGTKKVLSFIVTGPDETMGFCRVIIPKSLMEPLPSEKWQITIDQLLLLSTNITQDEYYSCIYFTYEHSTHKVRIKILTGNETTVYIDPTTFVVEPGDLFNVTIYIENMPANPGMVGVEFKITWNSTCLRGVNMTEVLFHSTMPNQTEIDENLWKIKHVVAPNYVWYAYTYYDQTRAKANGYAPISGNRPVAIITFNATAIGCSTLHFSILNVGGPGGEPLIQMSEEGLAGPYPGRGHLDYELIDGSITVKIPGDINGDGIVDIFDVIILTGAFGATPKSLRWSPKADMNGDQTINSLDAIMISEHFGKTVQ